VNLEAVSFYTSLLIAYVFLSHMFHSIRLRACKAREVPIFRIPLVGFCTTSPPKHRILVQAKILNYSGLHCY